MILNLSRKKTSCSLFLFFSLIIACSQIAACSEREDPFFPENVPTIPDNKKEYTGVIEYFTDKGTININTLANANYLGKNESSLIKNISNPNFSYCHPDVEYFPSGFNGYKYWMVFTPFFGSVGNVKLSTRFENPTVVVSNDGLNWTCPKGNCGPIQMAPSIGESFRERKGEEVQGFWSDVDWNYEHGEFSLYFRGSMIKAQALRKRGAKSINNSRKLMKNAQRTIVRQTSKDGVSWTPMEVAYTSNPPYSPKNNHILSPSFVYNGSQYISFEVENNISSNFPGNNPSYVIRRTSANGLDFSEFKQSKVVNFINKPWKKDNPQDAPWHLQASYVDGYYFLCIAVGDVKRYTSESLYLAVSKDGLNFKVFPKPMVEHNAYRSCVFPMHSTTELIDFGAVIGFKNGVFTYREFHINKSNLNQWI